MRRRAHRQTVPAPRDLHDVEVSAMPPEVAGRPGRGAFVVLWHRGVPLGVLDLDPGELPIASTALQAMAAASVEAAVAGYLADPATAPGEPVTALPGGAFEVGAAGTVVELLGALEGRFGPEPLAPSDVTVAVCTRDRPEALGACLDTLRRLRHPALEVLVVDNAPTSEATRRVVARNPGIRYVHEPRPGLDVARNAAVRASRGGIVAFTDDDVEVHPEWVARIEAAFADPSTMAATGLVLPAELDTGAQVLFEQRWSLGRGCVPRTYGPASLGRGEGSGAPVWEIGAGANMAFRRSVFDEVGMFDERLDVGAAGCSGDSELWHRILAAGHRIRYVPAAVVHHHHRRELGDLHRQLHRYMRGHVAALLVQAESGFARDSARRLALVLPRSYVRRALSRVRSGPSPASGALLHEVTGSLSGVAYFARHRRERGWEAR